MTALVDSWGVRRELAPHVVDEAVAVGNHVLVHVGFDIRHVAPEDLTESSLAFEILDGFPASSGRTLIVPRRLVASWFEATREQQHSLLVLVDELKALFDSQLAPDGPDLGSNAEDASGQTVMQLDVHLIPRYGGDVADLRGSIHLVTLGEGNDLAPAEPSW